MKKVKILSDIDGVLLNFYDSYLPFLEKETGVKNLTWFHIDYDLIIGDHVPYLKKYWLSKEFGEMSFFCGAKEFINNIPDGIQLDFFTNIDNNESITQELRKKNLGKSNIVFTHNKVKTVKEYNPDIIIEDLPKHVSSYLTAGFTGLIFVPRRANNAFAESYLTAYPNVIFFDDYSQILKDINKSNNYYQLCKDYMNQDTWEINRNKYSNTIIKLIRLESKDIAQYVNEYLTLGHNVFYFDGEEPLQIYSINDNFLKLQSEKMSIKDIKLATFLLIREKPDIEIIPEGLYCYDKNHKTCPYWDINPNKEYQANGFCKFLMLGDWGGTNLLFDQIKECYEKNEDNSGEDERNV